MKIKEIKTVKDLDKMKEGEIFNPYDLNGVVIPNFVVRHKGVSSLAKLCWGVINDLSTNNESPQISYEILSKELGVSEDRVKNLIKELKDNDLIREKYAQVNN